MAVSLAVQTTDDAPANEVERLQDENRTLVERLAGLENELARRDRIIDDDIEVKDKLSTELKESRREVDQLQHQLEEAEDEVRRAKGILYRIIHLLPLILKPLPAAKYSGGSCFAFA